MARARSPEKRAALLEAAVHEIAAEGLRASTADIARRAQMASGTLFTYFPTKEALLNELYLELKTEVYVRLAQEFPLKASLERRARYIWVSYLDWAIAYPKKRRVSLLLNVSDLLSAETRTRAAQMSDAIAATLRECDSRGALRELPNGFAAATMSALQDVTMEFIGRQPRRRAELTEQGFRTFWNAVR